MKIYTKKGDSGATSLIGGTRVAKHDLRIASYGTIDELNSYLGVVRDAAGMDQVTEQLIEIQDRLFTIGSSLASDPERSKMAIPDLRDSDVQLLEQWMDEMDAKLPELKAFILPGGHLAVSHSHVARTICRRAERLVTELRGQSFVDPLVLTYLNRLSDYLFVMGRLLGQELGAVETPWEPRK
ncbi:cob(I)yrinic acid a,c-diamide adenosyltransferase [Cryomorphaceae bacterium]|nr:cob(I)yrinic acid a,c-diamide adenosyltransferase [Cryomorphaceae bacterium]